MSQTYDYILEHGTLVNHDGEGQRDVGVAGGRIAAIGDLSRASAGGMPVVRRFGSMEGRE